MKKVMSLIAMLAMGAMLASCYSKACEEPQPMAPYKDMAPAAEEPVHHVRHHHHKHKHHHRHHKSMKNSDKSMSENDTSTQEGTTGGSTGGSTETTTTQ